MDSKEMLELADEVLDQLLPDPPDQGCRCPGCRLVKRTATALREADDEIDALRAALGDIAQQDISDEAIECGDVENAYRALVLIARQALTGESK